MKSLARDTSRSTSAWSRPTRTDGPQPDARLLEGDAKTRLILQEQQASRLRSSCFSGLKLRNPSWDMLVALLAAKRNGTQLSMSDLCLMCDAPESTALRLIHQLREKGYAEMVPDRSDRRRTRVSLTRMGETQFDSYLDKIGNA
ncbi:MarR family winged helix-turn-helix transcriptional regulator [Blastomonas sp.]|uniref:MarR family winged helix-turn-helix transcriptional regulator n=1 Tax=Blastomonas sp. TaxID=1909299 RepID=UPI002623C322|nr:MarR family winged helix-turn-helix transcriptional regulator [Blastomonas sp.]MDM7956874.1 MarR family winged helix-turn-helix transcriptional regulator [Blastomonas sp.]